MRSMPFHETPILHQHFSVNSIGLDVNGGDHVVSHQDGQSKITELAFRLRQVRLETAVITEKKNRRFLR